MSRLELAKIEAKNYESQRKWQISSIISKARSEALLKAKHTDNTSENVLEIAEKYYQFLVKDVDLEI